MKVQGHWQLLRQSMPSTMHSCQLSARAQKTRTLCDICAGGAD